MPFRRRMYQCYVVFLAPVNYYARFIPNMATKSRPLYDFLEKQRGFRWTTECVNAFNEIKTNLVSQKFLVHYDPRKQLVFTC